MSTSFELLLQARRLADDERLDAALSLLANAGDSDAVLGLRAELLVDRGRSDIAERSVRQLQERDPWRAAVEFLWLKYKTGTLNPTSEHLNTVIRGMDDGAKRIRARAALALGKLGSDRGELEAARAWLLSGLRWSREAADHALEAAFAGSLAEVLFLGGRVLESLDLLGLDTALIRPGSRHRYRLMVYRAHCYRQLGELEAARSLYDEAARAQELRGGVDGWALRGRLWTDALDAARRDLPFDGRPLGADENPHCRGHTLLALAWKTANMDLVREAAHTFERAKYTDEADWCSAVLGAPRTSSDRFGVLPIPEQVPMVCDAWVSSLELTELKARREDAVKRFRSPDFESGLVWMGTFF